MVTGSLSLDSDHRLPLTRCHSVGVARKISLQKEKTPQTLKLVFSDLIVERFHSTDEHAHGVQIFRFVDLPLKTIQLQGSKYLGSVFINATEVLENQFEY